jgi:two-component system response regulator QseB
MTLLLLSCATRLNCGEGTIERDGQCLPITTDGGTDDRSGDVVHVGEVRVELHPTAVLVAGRPVELAPRERAVLEVLSRRPGSVVNKHQLLAAVWHGEADGHAVEVTVGRLRRRLAGSLDIQTVPRRGYRLVAPAA